MKKIYSSSLFLIVFGFFFSFSSYGQLVANTDIVTVFNLNTTQIVIPNVLSNDTLNGIPVTLSDVTISQISATTSSLINLQSNGSVVLSAGNISAGGYVLSYEICQISVPTNCTIADAWVYIGNPPINAVNDAVTIAAGTTAPQIILENVLSNDTLNSIPITLGNAIISQISSTASNYFSILPNGSVTVINPPPAGTYTLNYNICQSNISNNCD